MIPANGLFPKSPNAFFSVRYDPADIDTVILNDGTVIESNFKRLVKHSYLGRFEPRYKKRDPQKEKRDLVRKSQAALDDPGRPEAIRVLFSPHTLDVYVIAKNGALVRAQTSPPDYCGLIGRLETEFRKEETK